MITMMKSFIRIVISALLLLLIPTCQENCSSRLDSIWEFINDKPDSALVVLNKYTVADFNSKKEKAQYSLLKSIALDKNYIDVASDTLVRIATDYYNSRGTNREKMLGWYYLGRVYANAKDYNNAIVSITRADEYSDHLDDLYYKALICMAKENIYSYTHNYSEALLAAKDGVRLFEKIGERNQSLLAKRKLALDYIALHDFSTADSLLLGIINNKDVDSTLVGRCVLNYAWSLALQEKYLESLVYYRIGTSEYHISLSLPQLEEYGVALYQTDQKEEADALRDRLKSVPSAKASYLLLCLQSYKKEGRYKEALAVQRELIQMEDSVAIQTMEQSIIKTQREYQRQNRDLLHLQSEKRRLSLIVLICLSLLLILTFAFIVRIIQRTHRKKTEQLMSSQEGIKKLLVEADVRNSALNDELALTRRQYVSAFKKRFTKIAHLSETYYRTSNSKDSRERVYREVRDLSSFITRDTRTYRQLEKNVDANLSNAMAWYREEYPGQDEIDYRIVCYLMAGFPASTISLLTGLTPSNVYVRKNRLLEVIQSGSAEHKDLFLLVI